MVLPHLLLAKISVSHVASATTTIGALLFHRDVPGALLAFGDYRLWHLFAEGARERPRVPPAGSPLGTAEGAPRPPCPPSRACFSQTRHTGHTGTPGTSPTSSKASGPTALATAATALSVSLSALFAIRLLCSSVPLLPLRLSNASEGLRHPSTKILTGYPSKDVGGADDCRERKVRSTDSKLKQTLAD